VSLHIVQSTISPRGLRVKPAMTFVSLRNRA